MIEKKQNGAAVILTQVVKLELLNIQVNTFYLIADLNLCLPHFATKCSSCCR